MSVTRQLREEKRRKGEKKIKKKKNGESKG